MPATWCDTRSVLAPKSPPAPNICLLVKIAEEWQTTQSGNALGLCGLWEEMESGPGLEPQPAMIAGTSSNSNNRVEIFITINPQTAWLQHWRCLRLKGLMVWKHYYTSLVL